MVKAPVGDQWMARILSDAPSGICQPSVHIRERQTTEAGSLASVKSGPGYLAMAEGPRVSVAWRADEQRPEPLSGLLRRCRARLKPECRSFGPYLRLPIRVGKAVTQEELAEAVGISRQWYARLESEQHTVVSPSLLARVADALMMDFAERDDLFRLAVPELRAAPLTGQARTLLEILRPLRSLTRRLWVANTEAEVLTIVREHAMTGLRPDLVVARTRVAVGRWEYAGTGDESGGERVDCLDRLPRERKGDAAVDDSLCYPILAQPGDVVTRYERDERLPNPSESDGGELGAVGWSDLSFAMTCVRSPNGFTGRLLLVHRTSHEYSDMERAELSTLAELASLALR
jgi:transcriptional regulator with XRE-family HTH domain